MSPKDVNDEVAAPPSRLSRLILRTPREAMQPVAAPPPPPVLRRRRSPLVSLASNFLTILVALGVVAGVLATVLVQQLKDPGPLPEDKVLVVQGSTWDIAEQLQREGIIRSQYLFMAGVITSGNYAALKKGEYAFRREASLQNVVSTIVDGKSVLHTVTIPEGLTSEQAVGRLLENTILNGDVKETPREGSILPDTYKFERGMSRERVIAQMQASQQRVLREVWAKRASDLPVRSPQELVILASIVEKETGRADERTRVASVFVNRMNKRMKLQSDPTIVYGLVGGKGTLGRGIMRSEIERATPFNTYVIEGLPPGPIANPGRAALEAVANPSRTRDLFFVADGTGGHVFAETYEQHLRNVSRWRQIERQRAPGEQTKPIDRLDQADDVPQQRGSSPASSLVPASTQQDEPLQAYDRQGNPVPAGALPLAAGQRGATGPTGTPGRSRSAVVDAVEGTSRDPLRSRNFDLNSAKTVPALPR